MDDRTAVAKDPATLMKGVRAWIKWSESVFLIENNSKLQLTARTAKGRNSLAAEAMKYGMEEKVKTTIEALGATTGGGKGRKLVPKELERLQGAREMAVLLKGIGGTREAKLTRHRVLVNSKAAYGWVARRPTQYWMRRLDNLAMRTGIASRTNRGLRMVLEGGNTALESIINARQVSMVATRMGKGDMPTYEKNPIEGSLQK